MLTAVISVVELAGDDMLARARKRKEWCFELTQREVDHLSITATAIFGVPIRIISEEEDAKREI